MFLALLFLLMLEVFDQQLAAGIFERHLELAIGGVALCRILCHRNGDGVAGQLGNLRPNVIWRG